MPWWKSSSGAHNHHLLPSASTSSSSSTPPRSGGSARGGRFMDSCFFPWSWWDAHPRLTHQRKLRHLNDIDIEALCLEEPAYEDAAGFVSVSRPSSHMDVVPSRSASSPMLLPHPLPLPKGALHRETASSRVLGCSPPNTQGCPLPSPFGSSGKVEGDDGNETASEHTDLQPVVGSSLAQQTNLRSPQQVDKPTNKKTISHRRKLSQDSKFSGIVDFRLNIPSKSVPVSQLSSPVGSPRRSGNVDSPATAMGIRGFQGWSATEILMTAYCSQNSPDKKIYSPERSSLSSPPTKNTTLRSRNSSAPPSPLQTKMFPESTAAWHDNGGNLNVHPLPLPPGPSPSQSAFAYHTAAKSEDSLKTSQWQKGKLIGSGTFGTVYEATNRHNGSLCAMKEVNIIPDDPKSAECLKQLEQEIKCLSQFKHPNIVQYYGSETIGDQLYIYLEYVHPGSINKYVRQYCGAMTESVVRCFTRHILNGLIYLHSKNIVHRDIKGANLLVDVKGVVKLADFGMAKHLSGAAPARSLKGSPFWMAPELMKELNELGKDSFEKTCFALGFSALSRMLQATMNKEIGYDLSVDIWSLGCTIIEMFTGKHPWSDLEGPQAMFKVLHTDPPIPESLSNDGKDFLHCCFRRNPAERPTATKLLDHPFVRNSNHQNHHANLHPSAGIKFDNAISLRDRNRSKSEPSVLKKTFSARENHQSYPELCDSAAPRPSRSNFDVIPSSSQNGMQYGAGNLQSYVLPKPHNKETQVLSDIK